MEDTLNFGIPMEEDTGANESGHEAEKLAAKLTQNHQAKFDLQTGKRLIESCLLDMAKEEMNGNCLWECYHKCQELPCKSPQEDNLKLGGSLCHV